LTAQLKFDGLEVIRALAALEVVVGHLFLYRLLPHLGALMLVGQWATEAVICFFVLSGVVITHSSSTMRHSSGRIRRYLEARIFRIYPIFLVALGLTLAVSINYGDHVDVGQYLLHLVFLYSKTGYPVDVVARNQPLWSLSNEMLYYVFFLGAFVWRRFMTMWTIVAMIIGFIIYPFLSLSGPFEYVAWMLAMSIPWLIGYWLVILKDRLPVVPISLGLVIFSIGLVYSRCNISGMYYDPFRLTAFALCSAALMLSVIQNVRESVKEYYFVRLMVGIPPLLYLWTIGHSMMATRIVLTCIDFVAMASPLSILPIKTNWKFLHRAFVKLGRISYAVYAIHVPLIYFTLRLVSWPLGVKLAVFLGTMLFGAAMLERANRALKVALNTRNRSSKPGAVAG
jgi:peptidoglycan/LPS O-acetylase OafA/YrhL